MSETNRNRWLLVAAFPLVVCGMIPAIVRFWPEILEILPGWAGMVVRTFALVAPLALMGAVLAGLVIWRRERRERFDA